MVPRENKNNAYAKFWRANKEYYGIFESGPCPLVSRPLKPSTTEVEVERFATEAKGRADRYSEFTSPCVISLSVQTGQDQFIGLLFFICLNCLGVTLPHLNMEQTPTRVAVHRAMIASNRS